MKQYLILLILLFSLTNTFGQGWEKAYAQNGFGGFNHVQQTQDGGYIATGGFTSSIGGLTDVLLVKTDVNGDTLWTRTYGGPNRDIGHAVRQTSDGGYIIAGVYDYYNRSNGEAYLIKTDANGDTLWTKRFNENSHEQSASDIYQTDDGGYIFGGSNYTNSTSNLNSYLYLVKTDSIGDIIWKKNHGPGRETRGYSVQPTLGGGYMIAGYTNIESNPGTGTIVTKDGILIKTDNNGDTLWTSLINESAGFTQTCYAAQQTQDSGYILVGEHFNPPFGYNVYLVKTDKNGIPTWKKSYGGSGTNIDKGYAVQATNDGGYIFVGEIYAQNSSSVGKDMYILKTDHLGDELWSKSIGSISIQQNYARSIIQNTDNSYLIAGDKHGVATLIKLDSLGHLATNKLSGIIYQDNNNNCSYDTLTDHLLSGITVQIEDSLTGQLIFATTDSNGYYITEIDTGTYFTSIASFLPYYQYSCQSLDTVVSNSLYQQNTSNFPLAPLLQCPLLKVDISAPLIRPTGTGSNYTINYRNDGTIPANNAYVEVHLDSNLIVLGTSIPITSQVGQLYTFNLGSINIGQSGFFTIHTIATPNTPQGQSICSEVHIYPDSICIPNFWNGPHLLASAQCANDTVYFEVRNKGATMSAGTDYYVYEDNIMLRTGTTTPLGTNGTDLIIQPAALGKTYRFEVEQVSGFPALLGDSIASVNIANCNPINGPVNNNFITQFSNGSSAPFEAIDCQPLRTSYDPNDKSAQPIGYGNNHFIYDYIALDYKIRFQNTGTDTAFRVVIRDTLSPYLNPASIQMGASSHSYTWRIYGSNILEVTFDNILLPDSSTNELASNGFFRFRVEQQANNPLGTVIYNSAAIYFDYNSPIITNQTFHTIGDNFVVMQLLSIDNIIANSPINIQVFPNPFKKETTLKIEGQEYNILGLKIYDSMGRLVQQQQGTGNQLLLQRNQLQQGLYFYQLEGDGELLNVGKLIVQ